MLVLFHPSALRVLPKPPKRTAGGLDESAVHAPARKVGGHFAAAYDMPIDDLWSYAGAPRRGR